MSILQNSLMLGGTLDTDVERAAAIGVGVSAPSILPEPGTNVGLADRQRLVWVYPLTTIPADNAGDVACAPPRRTFAETPERRTFARTPRRRTYVKVPAR